MTTWIQPYEFSCTLGSMQWADERCAELSAVAARLAVLLGRTPKIEFKTRFYACREALLTAAESQAAAGQVNEARAWARELVDPGERCMALIGVARGITGRAATDGE